MHLVNTYLKRFFSDPSSKTSLKRTPVLVNSCNPIPASLPPIFMDSSLVPNAEEQLQAVLPGSISSVCSCLVSRHIPCVAQMIFIKILCRCELSYTDIPTMCQGAKHPTPGLCPPCPLAAAFRTSSTPVLATAAAPGLYCRPSFLGLPRAHSLWQFLFKCCF